MPLVSICLPNLNTRPFLEERFATIFNQSFQDWELIVYDSYSDDGSWEYIQEQAKEDDRVSISQGPREGIYAAWNHCISLARGKYVYIATSDDTMALDCLEKLVAALEPQSQCDMAQCLPRIIDELGKDMDIGWFECSTFVKSAPELVRRAHMRMAPFNGLMHLPGFSLSLSITQLLIRRSLFEKIGLFESGWGSMGDFNWGMRAGLVANTIHVPDTWGGWRQHPAQATAQLTAKNPEYRRKVEEMIDHAIAKSEPWLSKRVRTKLKFIWRSYLRDKETYYQELRAKSGFLKRIAYICLSLVKGNKAACDDIQWRLTGRGDWTVEPVDLIQSWLRRSGVTNSLIRLPARRFDSKATSRILLIASTHDHPTRRIQTLCEMLESLEYDFHLFLFGREKEVAEAMRNDDRVTYYPRACPTRLLPVWRRMANRLRLATRQRNDIDRFRWEPLGAAVERTAIAFQPTCVILKGALNSWILPDFPIDARKVLEAGEVLSMGQTALVTRQEERKALQRADCILANNVKDAKALESLSGRPVLCVETYCQSALVEAITGKSLVNEPGSSVLKESNLVERCT